MNATEQARAAVKIHALKKAVLDSLREAGNGGAAPAGYLYAALSTVGLTLDQFNQLVATMERERLVKYDRTAHVIRALPGAALPDAPLVAADPVEQARAVKACEEYEVLAGGPLPKPRRVKVSREPAEVCTRESCGCGMHSHVPAKAGEFPVLAKLDTAEERARKLAATPQWAGATVTCEARAVIRDLPVQGPLERHGSRRALPPGLCGKRDLSSPRQTHCYVEAWVVRLGTAEALFWGAP